MNESGITQCNGLTGNLVVDTSGGQPYTISNLTAAVVRSNIPVTFRLAKKPSGELVLHGGFQCQHGVWGETWIEWEELPTIELPA